MKACNASFIKRNLPSFVRRFLLKQTMTRVETDGSNHPALVHVERALGWNVKCWVLWGLAESCPLRCLQLVSKETILRGDWAHIVYCQRIPPGVTLREAFLESVGCKHLDEFCRHISKPTLLVFSDIDRVRQCADTKLFVEDLMQRDMVKILLYTHDVGYAKCILRWACTARRIRLVYPIDCCRWTDLDARIATMAGCPHVTDEAFAAECNQRWRMAWDSLDNFIQHEWSEAGAVI